MHLMVSVRLASDRFAADRRGASAIEFAILSPIFFGLLFGIMTFGIHFGAANSVQQLCGDIARAAVAGVSESERVEIAQEFLNANVGKYILLKPDYLTVEVSDSPTEPQQFDVRVEYDASHLPTIVWTEMFHRPPPVIRSVATVRHGGF
ncbi:MAG: TadE/TadG family type IV pilus assembly protein [Pseudomonadota bacterium]|nr:TadE/TadG family type IV pilus assembly protein [Pseudomonadota bacterium]